MALPPALLEAAMREWPGFTSLAYMNRNGTLEKTPRF
jgi:hypothetical protein